MLGSLVVRLEEGEEGGCQAIIKIIRSLHVVCSWLRGVTYTFENLGFVYVLIIIISFTSIFFQDKNKFLLILVIALYELLQICM